MAIMLTAETEERLRQEAARTGQDVDALADALLLNALSDPDNLSEADVAEIRAGITRGMDAVAAGHERPLADYAAGVRARRAARLP